MILRQGDLGSLWPEWTGWRFDGPELWTPEDANCTAGEIPAIRYRQALNAEYHSQLREKVRQGVALREIKTVDGPGTVPCYAPGGLAFFGKL